MFVIDDDDNILVHYGQPRRSGRYPWGSGGKEHPQHNQMLIDHIKKLEKDGVPQATIAEGLGMSTTQLRAERSIAKNELKAEQINTARKLKEKAYSNSAAARKMGIPESTYRTLIAEGAQVKVDATRKIADTLKEQVDRQGIIDVGSGVDAQLGIPATRLNTAIEMLKMEGYEYHTYNQNQLTTTHETKMRVLCPPGTTQREAWERRGEIKNVDVFSNNKGFEPAKKHPIVSVNPKRVDVLFKEDGGASADGVIFVRPGVDDLSLGGNQFAQVRILVGKDKYLKGMAVQKEGLPDGVDLQFNTSKSKHVVDKLGAMKDVETNKDNPFGAITRQVKIDEGLPTEHVKSAMNLVNDKGDWEKWSNTLSSQMLSKQKRVLVKQQLDMTYERRRDELENIKALTNPVVKRKLLEEYADSTDAAAVHLKAAALPGQGVRVLLPLSKIKEGEIYAPGYNHGDTVVLVRHPHGGTFEIPQLRVNNRHPEGRELIGKLSSTAVGIHPKVAEHLSGADFDGDTVLVIPNRSGRVTTKPPLADLKGFDPKTDYPKYPGMKVMKNTQQEMGKISNLITDMTLKGASDAELARAVKHSMVVIDAEKHELNYRQSERDNAIGALKEKYQKVDLGDGRTSSGAATLISRARSEVHIPQRKPRLAENGGPIDRQTGELKFEPTNRLNKKGTPRLEKVKRLSITPNAHDLVSAPDGTANERVYADFSNRTKALANQARLDALAIKPPPQNPAARKVYAKQAASLDAKLRIARQNAPLERQAQSIANATYQAKVNADPSMSKDQKKKTRTQEIDLARQRVGARKERIKIEPDEWEAIQNGAISASRLRLILTQADMDRVREYSLPKGGIKMTPAKVSRMKNMLDLGYDLDAIASALGVSARTISTAIAEN